jgi:hypothetical protein
MTSASTGTFVRDADLSAEPLTAAPLIDVPLMDAPHTASPYAAVSLFTVRPE